ncbi:MAG: hypothetical protein RJQ00_08065 [Vicingaceae bacterium]
MRIQRYLFTVAILLTSSFYSVAQDSTKAYESSKFFPKARDIGVSLVVDGLIDNISLESNSNELGQNLLFVKYYLEDDLALRLGFGVNFNRYKRQKADSVGLALVEEDSTFSNYFINVSAGIEKHLMPTKRLDPFIFAQLDLTFIGKTNGEINRNETTSAGTARTQRTIKQDGGLGIGLQAGGGFNYFISPRFSLGTELAVVFQYAKEGGTISDNTIFTPVNGSSTSDFITREDQIDVAVLDVKPNAQLNISYFF